MPFRGVCACYLPEVGVLNSAVRRGVTGNVEQVEEVRPEVDTVLIKNVERLENRRIDLFIARSAKRPWPNVAEGVVGLLGKDALSVILVGTATGALYRGAVIGIQGTIHNL